MIVLLSSIAFNRSCKSFGLGTRVAYNGKEAVALCEQQQFSHSIITESLPDTDGISLFTLLQGLQAGVQGVLVSGAANLNTVWNAVGAGMRRVVAEPIDLVDILLAVEGEQVSVTASDAPSSLIVDDEKSIADLTSEEIRFEMANSDLVRIIRSVNYPFAGKDRLDFFDRDTLERLTHLVRRWCREQLDNVA